MGNVYASSSPPSPSGVSSFPTEKPSANEKSEPLENPGPLEDLHRKCKGKGGGQ